MEKERIINRLCSTTFRQFYHPHHSNQSIYSICIRIHFIEEDLYGLRIHPPPHLAKLAFRLMFSNVICKYDLMVNVLLTPPVVIDLELVHLEFFEMFVGE